MEIMRCTVRRQLLDVDVPTLVALTYDYINVKATFSSEWAGMQKWLHIRNVEDQSIIAHVVFNNDEIGEDVGLNLSAGEWDVWIHGALYEDNTLIKRITTNVKKIRVEATGSQDEILPSIGPSVAEQAVAAAERAEAAADEAEDSADAAGNYATLASTEATNAENAAAQALGYVDVVANYAAGASNSASSAQTSAQQAAAAVLKYPRIDDTTKTWLVWMADASQWVDTGVVARGGTFAPSVDTYGNLSWTNNIGLPNPPSVNLVSLFNNVPELQARMDEILAEAEAGVGDIAAQRDTILQSIASAAELGTDTTLSTLGMAADAKVTGLAIDANKNVAEKSLSYYGYDNDMLSWELGGLNASNGTELASTTVIRTVSYFDVTNIYNFTIEIPSGYRIRIFRYDDSGTFKSASGNLTSTKINVNTRSTPGTKYRFIFAQNATTPRNIYPQEGDLFKIRAFQNSESLLKLASGSQYLDTTVPLQKVAGVTKFPGNLFKPDNALNNYYIKPTDGDRDELSGYYATGWIPVVGGTKYQGNFGRSFAWYDSSYAYISGDSSASAIKNGVDAPANAAYIRFTISKTDDTSDLFDVYFTEAANYDPEVRIKGMVWTSRKIIGWMGDSIVAGVGFDEYVTTALNLRKYSYGVNQSTIAVNPAHPSDRSPMCQRFSSINESCDIIAVSGGTNDFQYSWSPIGDITMRDDGQDDTYFYGALKHLCRGIIDMFPEKVIFFTTPIKRAQPFTNGGDPTTPFSKNALGLTLGDYADIIKEVCGLYSIPVLDMYRESGLNPHLASQAHLFDPALTHPVGEGQKIMARRVAGWLSQLCCNIK